MAFFPRNFYHPQASFTPLFRLLEDFDSYARQGTDNLQPAGRRQTSLTHWQPKFDVHETADAYELQGELPGVTKENVSIEFSESQTLAVRGRIERSSTSGTPPAAVEAAKAAATTTPGDATPKSTHSHRATVEDEQDFDAQSREGGFEELVKKPADSNTALEKTPAAEVDSTPKPKVWLSERSVGEFSRAFTFPTRVDQEAVRASFENGILSITVPKAKKHEARRIAIN